MNLVVAIDDLHPEQGWGCEGDIQVEYLTRLNQQYGVKFTLFCPSYYHHEYKLTKDWVSYWKQFDWWNWQITDIFTTLRSIHLNK